MNDNHKNISNSKSFCTLAWDGISVSPTGTVSPCCLFEKQLMDDNGKAFRIFNDDISDIFNSNDMREIRTKMLKGEKIEACRQCYELESHGGNSLRKISNGEFYQDNIDYNTTTNYLPKAIDLKLNNKCNLKCRMCQPKDSNLIYNEFKEIIDSNHKFSYFENTFLIDPELKIDINDVPAWEDDDFFFDQFLTILPRLEKISIVGGEPLIIDSVYRLLDLIIEKGFAHKVYFIVTSNLMTFNKDKLKKYFSEFKQSRIMISLDATGTELNYIRYPSNFNKIENNFKSLYDLARGNSKVYFNFALTTQAYNALYLTNIFRFVERLIEEGYTFRDTPISFTFLVFPEHLSIDILPKNIREKAIERLEDYINNSKFFTAKNSENYRKGINQIIGTLKDKYASNIKSKQGEFLFYTNELDKFRNQNFKDALPELYLGFKEANISAIEPEPKYFLTREIGWELAEKGKVNEAILHFEKSAKTSPNKYVDYREIGLLYFKINQFHKAYKNFMFAFILEPNDKQTVRGIVLSAYRLNKIDIVDKNIKRSLEFFPQDNELKEIAKHSLST